MDPFPNVQHATLIEKLGTSLGTRLNSYCEVLLWTLYFLLTTKLTTHRRQLETISGGSQCCT